MRRLMPVALGSAFLLMPLFPAFITLTGVSVPGVSVVPAPLTLALVGVAGLIAVYCAASLITTPGEPVPTAVAFAALPAAAIVAAGLGFDPRAGALFIAIAVAGVVLHATIVRFFRDPHVEVTIFGAFLASGAIAALVAILMVVAEAPADQYTLGHGRAIGTFILPGELAAYLIVYVPFAYATARVTARSDLRLIAYAGTILGAIAFVLTFSRAGWIGMAAAIAYFSYTQRHRARVRVAVGIVGLAIVAVALVFNAHHDPSENFTRISIWRAASDMIARFPLSGVGPLDFATIYQWVRLPSGEPAAFHAHSFLLSVAAELGFIGIAAVGWGWWRFIGALREELRGGGGSQTIAFAIVAGLVGTWVQSLIDTVSLVIFVIWPMFTALALVTARSGLPSREPVHEARRRLPRLPRPAVALAVAVLLLCAFVQLASDAVFARAGAPLSLPGRLNPELGTQLYRAIARVAPLPFVEATLADAALRDGDLDAASARAERLPPGTVRSETLARIAEARGRTVEAMGFYLDAGDDRALQRHVDELVAAGEYGAAYRAESRVRDRLDAVPTRPNAAADSWWRLGRIALRMHRPAEAKRDFARADALAPLNTKYLIDAATLALDQHDWSTAAALFVKARQIDPGSAVATAGLGLASLQRGDVSQARRWCEAANAIDGRALLARRLKYELAAVRFK